MNRKSIMLFISLILLFFMLFIGLSAYLKTQKGDITKEDYLYRRICRARRQSR